MHRGTCYKGGRRPDRCIDDDAEATRPPMQDHGRTKLHEKASYEPGTDDNKANKYQKQSVGPQEQGANRMGATNLKTAVPPDHK